MYNVHHNKHTMYPDKMTNICLVTEHFLFICVNKFSICLVRCCIECMMVIKVYSFVNPHDSLSSNLAIKIYFRCVNYQYTMLKL